MKKKYFAFDEVNGEHYQFESAIDAKEWVACALEFYRNEACDDGWPEGIEGSIGWGKIEEIVVETKRVSRKDFTPEEWEDMGYSDDWDYISDYGMSNKWENK